MLATVGEAAAQAEAATGTRVVLLACLMGGVDPAWNQPVLDAAIRRMDAGVVGVDLAGPVEGRTPAWVDAHAAMFDHARASGLCVTVHAGEAEPPAAIRTALDRYLADRIGHATSLAEDPDLLAEVVERRVVLECCPRSNYWTRTEAELPELADHPVGRLLAAGARVCLNTDDRTLFGNDLSSEYRVVAEAHGLDDRQVAALTANGFAGAFHPGRAAAALERAVGRLDGPPWAGGRTRSLDRARKCRARSAPPSPRPTRPSWPTRTRPTRGCGRPAGSCTTRAATTGWSPTTPTSTRCCATAASAAPTCTWPATPRWAGPRSRRTWPRSGT